MAEPAVVWGEVLSRLGLVPVGTVEDGLRFQVETASATLEVQYRAWRDPISVRVVVRPLRCEGRFLLAPADRVPVQVRWKTGDAAFDERVAILAGGRAVLPRLGVAERERLLEVIGETGAVVGAEEATLEPAVTARLTDPKDATGAVRDLVRIATRLAVDPPVEELLDRWYQEDGAPAVSTAVGRRVVEVLPNVTEEQAETACRLLLERGADTALPLLTVMPPYPCVLSAWFKTGDPLDPRVVVRVVDAWRAGSPRPAARYLAWLLARPGVDAAAATMRLWQTPGLADDAGFVREFLRSVRRDPPPGALPLLLQISPRSSSVARRLARALSCYSSSEVDRRLLEWLSASSSGIRQAAATSLADRAAAELVAGGRASRLEPTRVAASGKKMSELVAALLERVPHSHTAWLVPIRPHDEPDAVALIRRLGAGGADCDDALLFWLDRGTPPVRIEAARALANVGTTRVLPALRERASGWFSEGGVREACKLAIEAIRKRAGGPGNLAIASTAGGELAEPTTGEVPRKRDAG